VTAIFLGDEDGLVQFTADAAPALADGSITTTFRRWKRAQAKVGGTYRPWDVPIRVTAVSQVAVGDLTDADARSAGEPDLAALLRRLGGPAPADVVWRVDFHRVDAPDPRIALRADDALDADAVAGISARLDRLDRSSPTGAWTRPTLAAIRDHPAVVSSVLADVLGRERPALKLDIRKLKGLGLTESLGTGYRLSPRGEAYLAAAGDGGDRR
jgi:hypothetical protein